MAQVQAVEGGIQITITDPDELERVFGALKRTKSSRVATLRSQIAGVIAGKAAEEFADEIVTGFEKLLTEEVGE